MCECGHDLMQHPPDPARLFAWPCRVCPCNEFKEKMMDIGKEKEKITVEPIVNPVPEPTPEPQPEPAEQPAKQPEKEPVKV